MKDYFMKEPSNSMYNPRGLVPRPANGSEAGRTETNVNQEPAASGKTPPQRAECLSEYKVPRGRLGALKNLSTEFRTKTLHLKISVSKSKELQNNKQISRKDH